MHVCPACVCAGCPAPQVPPARGFPALVTVGTRRKRRSRCLACNCLVLRPSAAPRPTANGIRRPSPLLAACLLCGHVAGVRRLQLPAPPSTHPRLPTRRACAMRRCGLVIYMCAGRLLRAWVPDDPVAHAALLEQVAAFGGGGGSVHHPSMHDALQWLGSGPHAGCPDDCCAMWMAMECGGMIGLQLHAAPGETLGRSSPPSPPTPTHPPTHTPSPHAPSPFPALLPTPTPRLLTLGGSGPAPGHNLTPLNDTTQHPLHTLLAPPRPRCLCWCTR